MAKPVTLMNSAGPWRPGRNDVQAKDGFCKKMTTKISCENSEKFCEFTLLPINNQFLFALECKIETTRLLLDSHEYKRRISRF